MEGLEILAHHVLTSRSCSRRGLSAFIFSLRRLDQRATSTGWAHLDSNQGPIGYEPTALTAELWAHRTCSPTRRTMETSIETYMRGAPQGYQALGSSNRASMLRLISRIA